MEDLDSLNRKQLQALCKKHGLPANKSNRQMAHLLASALKKTKVNQSLIPEDPGKPDNESESKDLPKKLRKVRFSPENETRVYEPSAVRPKVRRRTAVVGASKKSIDGAETEGQRISGEVSGNSTRMLRSRVRNAVEKDVDTVSLPVAGRKRGRGSKKIESNGEEKVNVNGEPTFTVEMSEVVRVVQDEAEMNRGMARRRLRSREVIIEESAEGGRGDLPVRRNNSESGRLGTRRNGEDSQASLSVNGDGRLEEEPTILTRRVGQNSALAKGELAGMTTRSRAKLEEKSSSAIEVKSETIAAKDKHGKGVRQLRREVATGPLSEPISVAKSSRTEAANRSTRSGRNVAEVSSTTTTEAKAAGVKEGCKGPVNLGESWKANRNSRRLKSFATQKAEAGNKVMEVKKETKKRTRNSDFKVITKGESSVETREDIEKASLVLGQPRRSRRNTVLFNSIASSNKTGIEEAVGRTKQLGQKISDQPLRTKRNVSRRSFVANSSETDIVCIGNVRQVRQRCEPALEKGTSSVVGETFGENSPIQSRRRDYRSDSVGVCERGNTIEKKKQTPFGLPFVVEEPTFTGNISPSGGGPIEGFGLTTPQATEEQNYSSLDSMEDVQKSDNHRTASKSKWGGKRKNSVMDASSIDSDMNKGIGVETQSEEILASASPTLQGALTDQEALQIASEPLIVDAAANVEVDDVQQLAASGLTLGFANDQSCGTSGIDADFSIGDLSTTELLEFQAKCCDAPVQSSGLSSENNRTASKSKWSGKGKTSFMDVSSIYSDRKKGMGVKTYSEEILEGTGVKTYSEEILDSASPKLQSALTDQEALEIVSEPLVSDAATKVAADEVQKIAVGDLSPGGADDQSRQPSEIGAESRQPSVIGAEFSIGNLSAPEQLEFEAKYRDMPSHGGLSNLSFAGWKGLAIEELSAGKHDTVAVNNKPIEGVGPSTKGYGVHDLERSQKGIKIEKTELKVLHPNMRASPTGEASIQLDGITLSSHEKAIAQVCKEENIGLEESSRKFPKAEKSVHDFFNIENLSLNASEVNYADRVDQGSAADVASKSASSSFSLSKLNESHQQEYLLQDEHTLSVTSSVKRAGREAKKPDSYDVNAPSEELASNSYFKNRKEALEGINPDSLFQSFFHELVDEKRDYPSIEKCQQHRRNLTAEEKVFADNAGEKASFSEATAPLRDELVSEMLHDNGTVFSERKGNDDAVKDHEGESPNSTREKRLVCQECSKENVHVRDDITEGDSVHVNSYTTEGGRASVQWYDISDLEISAWEGDITTDEVECNELYRNERASLAAEGRFQLDGHDPFSSQVTGAKADHPQEKDQPEHLHALSASCANLVDRTDPEARETENLVAYPCDVDVAAEKMSTSNAKCEGELEALGGIRAGSLPQSSSEEFQDLDQVNSSMDKSSSDGVFGEEDSGDFTAEDREETVGFDRDSVKVLLSDSSTPLNSPEPLNNRKIFAENCSCDSVVGVPVSRTSQKIIAVGIVEEFSDCGDEFLPKMVSADCGPYETSNTVEDTTLDFEDNAGNLHNRENVKLDNNSFYLVDNPIPIGVKAADMREVIGSMASDPMVTFNGSEDNKVEAEVGEVNTGGNCTENILYTTKRDANSLISSQITRSGRKQAKKSSAGDVDTEAGKAAYFLGSDLRASSTSPTGSGCTNNSDIAKKTSSFSIPANMVLTGYNSNKNVDVEQLYNATSSRLMKDADCPLLSPVMSCSHYADSAPSEFGDETALFTEREVNLFQSNEEFGTAAGSIYGNFTGKDSGHAMQEKEEVVAIAEFDGQVTELQLTPDVLNEPENISSPSVQGITDREFCTTIGMTNILEMENMKGTLEQSILERASHDVAGTMPRSSCNEQEMNRSAEIISDDNLCSKFDITLYGSTVTRQNDSPSDEEEQRSNVSNNTDRKEITYDRGSSFRWMAQLPQGDNETIAGENGRLQGSIGGQDDAQDGSRLETNKEDSQGVDEREGIVNEAAVYIGYVGLQCLPCLDNKVLSVVHFNECPDHKSLNVTSALDCHSVVNCSTVSGVHASNYDNKSLEPNLLFEDGEQDIDGKSDSEALIIDLISEVALEVQENETLIEQATIPVTEEQDSVKKDRMEEELSEQNCTNTAVLDKPKSEEVQPLEMHEGTPAAVDYAQESFNCENLDEHCADIEPPHCPSENEILKEAAKPNDFHDSALFEFKVEYDPSDKKQVNVANFSVADAGQAAQLTEEVLNQGSVEDGSPGAITSRVSPEIAPKDIQTYQKKFLSPQKISSHAKRKESNSLFAKQLGSSVMKGTKVKIGAIQVTPQKTQHYDYMKENESSTKIEKSGDVTAVKTLSTRRPLRDISKN